MSCPISVEVSRDFICFDTVVGLKPDSCWLLPHRNGIPYNWLLTILKPIILYNLTLKLPFSVFNRSHWIGFGDYANSSGWHKVMYILLWNIDDDIDSTSERLKTRAKVQWRMNLHALADYCQRSRCRDKDDRVVAMLNVKFISMSTTMYIKWMVMYWGRVGITGYKYTRCRQRGVQFLKTIVCREIRRAGNLVYGSGFRIIGAYIPVYISSWNWATLRLSMDPFWKVYKSQKKNHYTSSSTNNVQKYGHFVPSLLSLPISDLRAGSRLAGKACSKRRKRAQTDESETQRE